MTDFEDATSGDFILLGGQISNKIKEFQTIAQLDPKTAFVVMLLDKLPEIQKKTALEQAREIMLLKGQINFMAQCGELTKLSAIMGDTRKSYSSRGMKDVFKNINLGRYNPNSPASTP